MPWFEKIKSAFVGPKKDLSEIRRKVQMGDAQVDDAEIMAYIDDLNARAKSINKDLKHIYKDYGIIFSGFKSFEQANSALRGSLKGANAEANNQLIKLETDVMIEQRRHLALIRMAITKDNKKVIEEIMRQPETRQIYCGIFGLKDANMQEIDAGLYQKLWGEIHKLAEYLIINKNKIYH